MQPAQAWHTPAPSRARPDTGEAGEVMALPGQAQQEFSDPEFPGVQVHIPRAPDPAVGSGLRCQWWL